MIPQIAFLLMAAWSLYGVIGPWVGAGDRNRHNLLRVQSNGDPYPRVQEIGEWRLCKLVGLLVSVPVFVLATLFAPSWALIGPAVFLATDNHFRAVFIQDAAGHGAEIMAAEKADVSGYRAEEIQRLQYENNWRAALGFTAPGDLAKKLISDKLDQTSWLAKIVYHLAY